MDQGNNGTGGSSPGYENGEPKGLKFLELYSSRESSKAYRNVIRIYLSTVLGRDVPLAELQTASLAYFSGGRDYRADIELFLGSLRGRAPLTVLQRLAIARVFLMENGVELPQLFWRGIRRRTRGSRALTIDRVPSNDELKKILQHAPLRGKALFLTLASSGMRIGECISLELEDLKLSQVPALAMVRGRHAKTGNSRSAYISGEAREAIQEWLKTREDYMRARLKRGEGLGSYRYRGPEDEEIGKDQRAFPFSMHVATELWYNAMKKAGFYEKDPDTGHSTLHPHVLRKFFRTRMGAVIPVDVVEALMGHEGYLTRAYRRYSQEDLAKFYAKGEHTVSIFSNPEDLKRVRAEFADESRALRRLMEDQAIEHRFRQKELEEKLQKELDDRLAELAKRVQFKG